MKTVPLTGGGEFLVDDDDYAWVSERSWYAQGSYVYTWVDGENIALHRLLVGAGEGEVVDHRDGDGRNNQRANLRRCSQSNNQHNRRKHCTSSSRFKGVSWNKQARRWVGHLEQRVDGKRLQFHLGSFDSEEAAARAYDAKALERFGEFARLNFPIASEEAA